MEIHYQLTADDLCNCFRSHFVDQIKRSGNRRVSISVGVLLLVLVGILGILGGPDGLWLILESKLLKYVVALPVIMATILGLYYWLAIPRFAAKQFAQVKSVQRTKSVRVDEGGLRYRDEFADSLVPWGDIWRWSESNEGFLLYLSARQISMLPKRAFESLDQITRFREILKTRISSEN